MGVEFVEFIEQAGPYVTAAVGAYGGAVLSRAEDAAVDATANLGRRVLHAVWHHHHAHQHLHQRHAERRAELERAVQEAARGPLDADAAATLCEQINRAVQEDTELLKELAELLPLVSATSAGRK